MQSLQKIAIVTPILPFPPDSGSKIRIYNIIKFLSREGFQLHLFSYDSTEFVENSENDLLPFFKEIRTIGTSRIKDKGTVLKRLGHKLWGRPFPPRPLLEKKLASALKKWKPDFIQLEKTMSAAYIPKWVFEKNGPGVVLEEGGVHHLSYERTANAQTSLIKKMVSLRRASRLKTFESKILNRVSAVVAVSEEEALLLRRLNRSVKILNIPNGIDEDILADDVRPAGDREKDVFFCGNLAYQPNADAVDSYANHIMPELEKRGLSIHFMVAGDNISEKLSITFQNQPLFHYLGYVDDIYSLFKKHAIFVNPMRLGGGTRLKMVEAMGLGMACVTTSIGAEGLEVVHGVHCLIADTPEKFAEQIQYLINNPDQATKMGDAARSFIRKRYTWNRCLAPLAQYYRDGRPA